MLVAGVDEAGRGCVIGPLVVAGVAVKTENLQLLTDFGVKDSKLLTAKKREALYPEIIKLTEKHHIIKVPPAQIDKVVRSSRTLHKLNRLEAQTMAKIIEVLRPDEAYVDAADVVQEVTAEQSHPVPDISTSDSPVGIDSVTVTAPLVEPASAVFLTVKV